MLKILFLFIMYKINVNNDTGFSVANGKEVGEYRINDTDYHADIVSVKSGTFHILLNNKGYRAEIIETDDAGKVFKVNINGTIHTVAVHDRYDELLEQLGMDSILHVKAASIKAPMPGLVLGVRVETGQQIIKGDPVVVLEAMKMENILKSPGEGIVKKILVNKGDKVEKNDLLIELE
jgi:biotin carboxyl carrier protein